MNSPLLIDSINIDSTRVEVYKKKKYILFKFICGKIGYDRDNVSVYLKLPLRFDEEWFKKYKKYNFKNIMMNVYFKFFEYNSLLNDSNNNDDDRIVENGGNFSIYLPFPIRFDEELFKKFKGYNYKHFIKEVYFKFFEYNSLLNDRIIKKNSPLLIDGINIDRINIDADGVNVYKKKEYIQLEFKHGIHFDDGSILEDGGDYASVYLPLPLIFNEEWFKKYKELNLNEESIKAFKVEGYIN